MFEILATIAAAAVAVVCFLHITVHYSQNSDEPPLVSYSLPFIGPMIGLTRKKTKYYVELRNKLNLPIYTLRLLGTRLYVVNSTSLITSVQRQSKVLAFPPIEAAGAANVCDFSQTMRDILNTNTNGDEGPWGYSPTFYKAIHTPLAPGSDLDAMNRVMAERIVAAMDAVKEERILGLFEFVRHEITLATTESIYGSHNPFKDIVIENDFWKFQPGIMVLLLRLPSFLARESIEARERIVNAFTQYFKAGAHDQGSALVRARYDHSHEHGVPLEDIARSEVGGAIAILSNTSPATFWMQYHIYSDPAVLKDCRRELHDVISEGITSSADGKTILIRTIDLSHVKQSCPLLLSTLQEVLRVHTIGISARLVMEDHMLDKKYLLKKGNTVLMPGPVQHTDTSTWGPNADRFDHRRFLPENRRHNPVVFRGFGGGTTLCPGRHFASTEILAFTAMLILRFDITPLDGKWTQLTTTNVGMWETTPGPDFDIKVLISPRAGENSKVVWRILVTDSDKAMPISAEDF